jgi:hypothetical protein
MPLTALTDAVHETLTVRNDQAGFDELRRRASADARARFTAGQLTVEEFERLLDRIEHHRVTYECCGCGADLAAPLAREMSGGPVSWLGSPSRRQQRREARAEAKHGPRASAWWLTCGCGTDNVIRFESGRT